mmetsp:Transcript_61447/g.70450  ORF Transcript_61447/g.70450 Transcript_61447/m.70450 type:complete len:105 (-) Transcript_61447:116-430(-)
MNAVVILDVRMPANSVCELSSHTSCVNAISWAPHSANHLCTAGDDAQALIWDVSSMSSENASKVISDPILAYTSEAEINMLQWSPFQTDWVGIVFNKKLQILRV